MIHWFHHLPQLNMNPSEWTHFIQNSWFRKHFMKFAYLLQIIVFLVPGLMGGLFTGMPLYILILIGIAVFIVHEFLHIVIVYKKGDISLTFSGTFFWLNTNAILSKRRFLVFMSLPFIGLSVVPAVVALFVSGDMKILLLFVSWINFIISAADIINSVLIAVKPRGAVFCRGYYRIVQMRDDCRYKRLRQLVHMFKTSCNS
jgi:Putative zincin peptidase